MKTTRSKVAIAMGVALMFSASAHANFLERLVDRVERSVENAVSGTVANKASREAADATEAVISPEAAPKKEEAEAPAAAPSASAPVAPAPQAMPQPAQQAPSMSGGGFGAMLAALQKPADFETSYSFNYMVESEIKYDGEITRMIQGYGEDHFFVDLAEENQKIVMDLANESMVMINDQERTVSAMSTDIIKSMTKMGGAAAKNQGTDAQELSSIRKTGQTKQIAGYQAHQWVYEGPDSTGEMWVAESLDFDFVGFNKRMMALFDSGGHMTVDFSKVAGQVPMGLPLEVTSYDNGKVDVSSTTLSVSENPPAIELSGYKVQSMMDQ